MTSETRTIVKIAPNNPVFDLPVIVGIEEGLFAKVGLDVSFSATYADREKDSAEEVTLGCVPRHERTVHVIIGRWSIPKT